MSKQYAVAHVSKGKGASTGLTKHFDRESLPPNADPERTHLNEYENHSSLGRHLGERADTVIQRAGVTRKVQANAVKYCPIILSGSHDQMKAIEEAGQIDQWYKDTKQFAEDRYGKENIISFVMHRDEETPHIHCTVVPIIKDQDKNGNDRARLSAREKFNRQELLGLQDDYAKAMKPYRLERGERGSKATHTTVQQFYNDLPDKIRELEKEVQGKQGELTKLKALSAQYSAAKGLKQAAEGAGAGLKEFMTGGKKKREGLEAENQALKARITELEPIAELGTSREQIINTVRDKLTQSMVPQLNEILRKKEVSLRLAYNADGSVTANDIKPLAKRNEMNRNNDKTKGHGL